MKGSQALPAVEQLMKDAKKAGVDAAFVEVETFDAFMLQLWRNLDDKDPVVDAKVRKSYLSKVSIPLSGVGKGLIVRMNGLPILSLPAECQSLTFENQKDWGDLRAAAGATEGNLIFTKSDAILCWGQKTLIRSQFTDLVSVSTYNLSQKIADIGNHLHIKGFLEEALCRALARDKPLLTRTTKTGSYLIADPHRSDQSGFDAICKVVSKYAGQIPGVFAPVDEDHPHPEKVHWAEALRVSMEIVDGRAWLLLDPDVWIWPPRARKDAATFLDERRGNRYNSTYNGLMDAWLSILLGNSKRKAEIYISAYEGGTAVETPSFSIGTRTAYTRALV
jgi:hypothetical protein